MIRDSNDETNFPHKSLLTDAIVSNLCTAFTNDSSANRRLSKFQPSKMVQLGLSILFFGPILSDAVKGDTKAVKRGAPILAKNAAKCFVNQGVSIFNKKLTQREGSGTTNKQ